MINLSLSSQLSQSNGALFSAVILEMFVHLPGAALMSKHMVAYLLGVKYPVSMSLSK